METDDVEAAKMDNSQHLYDITAHHCPIKPEFSGQEGLRSHLSHGAVGGVRGGQAPPSRAVMQAAALSAVACRSYPPYRHSRHTSLTVINVWA